MYDTCITERFLLTNLYTAVLTNEWWRMKAVIVLFHILCFSLLRASIPSRYPTSSNEKGKNTNRRKYTKRYESRFSVSCLDDKSSMWVKNHCRSFGNELYVEVPTSFINDPVTRHAVYAAYNSTRTASYFPYVDDAIRLMTDLPLESATCLLDDDNDPKGVARQSIEHAARDLYDLFHAKYVVSNDGLRAIMLRFRKGSFGQCPRVFCQGSNLLPVGLHNKLAKSTVKCFCSKCRDVYHPGVLKHRRIDGAAFGTTLPHLLLQRYPQLSAVKPSRAFVPGIYGFKIHESAQELQTHRGVERERDSRVENNKSLQEWCYIERADGMFDLRSPTIYAFAIDHKSINQKFNLSPRGHMNNQCCRQSMANSYEFWVISRSMPLRKISFFSEYWW